MVLVVEAAIFLTVEVFQFDNEINYIVTGWINTSQLSATIFEDNFSFAMIVKLLTGAWYLIGAEVAFIGERLLVLSLKQKSGAAGTLTSRSEHSS